MNKREIPLLLHVSVWAVLFLMPLTFFNHGNGINLMHYLMSCMAPLMLMTVFYVNYSWLTPHYFMKGKKRTFWVVNVVMIVSLGVALHYWMSFTHGIWDIKKPHHEPNLLNQLVFVLRDIFNFAVAATVATAIRLAMRWQHAEKARLAAEAAHAEAELRNLRSQINPHFLLNTLNNIYALTAFDTERAQAVIEQLSKLLRYMLYDNQDQEVALADEIQFLESYVNLMKIRLPKHVEADFSKAILPGGPARIAPLIFISLVENAFKHGISPTEPSFVHIKVESSERQISCCIENSNYPKDSQDHSGHGIGLWQVQRRLELAYPDRFVWTKGVSDDGKTYRSQLILKYP